MPIFLSLIFFPVLSFAQGPSAVARPQQEAEGLFLDMSKLNLGTISSEEAKQNFIYTIQLEKARITRKTLHGVYESAFALYKRGEYDAARELTAKILSIDPTFEDAAMLQRASVELKGSKRPFLSQTRLVDDKFEEGMGLYRQGRVVEAVARWDEASKLSALNLKVKYWLKKAQKELSEEHFRRGEKAYRQHRLRETLEQWYAALALNPRYPRLNNLISKVESETRELDANDKLQSALNLYGEGRIAEALKMLESVLELGPGNAKAQRLMVEIRSEVASQHVEVGRKLYESRKYNEAIAQFKQAAVYGYETRAADQLIGRAHEAIRREEAARRRAVEAAKAAEDKRKADEETKAKAEEEQRKKDLEAKASGGKAQGAAALGQGSMGLTSDEARHTSQQHYLSGMVYYSKGDYVKAREEWSLAKQLDPSNADAQAGLERIEKLYGGGH